MSRIQQIAIWLDGFEQHKARPDLSDDSGYWLRVRAEDTAPFVAAYNDAPGAFHEFVIEQRVGRETRTSRLVAQIVKVEEGPADVRVLIRPTDRQDHFEGGGVWRRRKAAR